MKQIKTTEQLNKRLDFLHGVYQKQIHCKVVNAVNEYLENNGKKINYYNLPHKISVFVDDMALSAGWIADRLQGKSGLPSSDRYKGSLTRKIRKALGYSI